MSAAGYPCIPVGRLLAPEIVASSPPKGSLAQVRDGPTQSRLGVWGDTIALNRRDFGGDSIAWRIMESWQNTAAPALRSSGVIGRDSGNGRNTQRLHGARGDVPPAEFEAAFHQQLTATATTKVA